MGESVLQVKPDPVFKGTQQHRVLIDMVRRHDWKQGAEIGLLRGKTLFALLDACGDLSMIGIDQWKQLAPSEEDGAEHYQRFNMADLERQVKARARHYGDRCTILHMTSARAAGYVPDASLDFVFIDAAHTEAAVGADIEAWLPKVKIAGWITGHDWNWPSVARAIDARLPGWQRHDENVWSIPRELAA
jgi:hypothetical protein